MNTYPLESDKRWSITQETFGRGRPIFIIKFNDEWVGQSLFYETAAALALNLSKNEREPLKTI